MHVIVFKAQELCGIIWYQSPLSSMKLSLFYHVLPTYNSLPCKKAVKAACFGSQQAHRKAQSWMEAMRCQMNREAWFTLVATCMGYACSS